jgi:DNA gyrase subunit A
MDEDNKMDEGKKEGKVHKIEEYFPGKIEERTVEKEIRTSYLDYAMSVIVGRALPDVRDGLKPVHRRILFGMHELGNTHDKPYKKSARIVGEILGKYHPHGDAAIYESIVRMVRDFSLRYPLIDGQGNFGSIDGDGAAAMRYTEVRMNRLSGEMLGDIDRETVDFAPNFDGTLKEPLVLPCKIPNLLVNGSSGIAVGMATNIPPHNLGETVDGAVALIDNPNLPASELLGIIKGPDFPTAGLIIGRRGIAEAHLTGRGSIKIRARAAVEEGKGGRRRIVVSELPYQVNKAQLIENIVELVKQRKITGISDINDRSDREGMRIEIELKREANEDVVLKQLYAHTPMETTFGVINLALVGNQPKVLPLRDMLNFFILHRKEIITKRSAFDLRQATERAHILEGLRVAIERIDDVTKTIKEAKDSEKAMTNLMKLYSLSEEQAKAILEMKLRRLTTLERDGVEKERSELLKKIEWLKGVLNDEKQVYSIIKEELLEMKKLYGDKRRTEIAEEEEELEIEDLIPRENVAILITRSDYIKRIPLVEYKTQGRGGKGVIGTEVKEEDVVRDVIIASTHDYMLFFTDRGIVHWLKVYRIPAGGRYSMGKAIVNLLELKNEKVSAWIPVKEFGENQFLVMATRKGVVKRTAVLEYSRPRKGGIIALTLRENDALMDVKKTDGKKGIMLGTKDGYAIRFGEQDTREIGRAGQGVRGIRLRKGDEVKSMTLDDNPTILTITENGYGKRTDIREYRIQGRGGKGIINIQTRGRNGPVVGVESVSDEDELLLISSGGKVIRVSVRAISVIGRNTQGVRMMRLAEGEKVVAIGRVTKGEIVDEKIEGIGEAVGEMKREQGGEKEAGETPVVS